MIFWASSENGARHWAGEDEATWNNEETGLIGGAEQREIVILAYDPTWPAKFEVHAGTIARALGETALRIEHIGSTSVPGLAAKPVIDRGRKGVRMIFWASSENGVRHWAGEDEATWNNEETGLIGGAEKREIVILDYDPTWPAKFEAHAGTIAWALGETALRIEHIGSTSVPGLAAKPVIDILVVVPDSTDESTYLPQLEAVGYQLRVREPDWNEHRMLRTPERDVHVHIYSSACREIERNLTFRDRLRSNATDRARYEQTKRKLAAQPWPDTNAYADAKGDTIESIIASAREAGEISR